MAGIDAGGVTTRGDSNGGNDPWTLHDRDLVGRASAVLPQVGWLIRALPILLVGDILVLMLSRAIRRPATRVATRVLGFTFITALAVFVFRPFVNATVITVTTTRSVGHAMIASTGILPISVHATGGSSVHLVSGEVGHLSFPALRSGHYQLVSTLDLPWWGWIVFGLVCAIPLLWCLIVGLPADPERRVR